LKELRKAEVEAMGENSVASFDHIKLRERLRVIVPLQKLYEKIFFDDYDLASVCRPHDMYSDLTLKKSHFKKLILRDVPSIQREANE
jgi:hypothetical protein